MSRLAPFRLSGQPRKPPAWPGRFWPQKVRTKLTLIYALLFLIGGSALLGLTYGLVAASLPAKSGIYPKPVLSRADYIRLCKKPQLPVKQPVKPGTSPVPRKQATNLKLDQLCQQAYVAGLTAGSSDQRDRALHSLLVYSLAGLGVMTIASAGAGWMISGRILRPVRAITATARRASEQHLGERIGLSGARDELKELADTFDDMLERLDRAFAAQRRFVADASHELRTPLTLMRTAIDVTLAKPGRTPEQLEAMAARVRATIERAQDMVDALLTLAVSDQGVLTRNEPFDLATAAEDAVDQAATEISRQGLRVAAELDPAQVTGDPQLLDRMISNLVGNAVRHNTPGGHITLRSGLRDGMAFLRVSNSGPEIPAEIVPALFEPFRRMDGRTGSREGAGLGLAIARSIASLHGTSVRAESRLGGGLDVEITMPGSGGTLT